MNLILDDRVSRFKKLFTDEVSEPPKLPSTKISPSGLACEVAVAWKLQGIMPEPDVRSFERDGYASSGNARHAVIQEFLSTRPEIEWVDVGDYVKEHDLPFTVEYEYGIEDKAKKYGLSPDQICELVGSHEKLLKHKNGLMSFKLDGLIKFEGNYYIVEIKTCSESDLSKAPLDKHQLQGKTYALMLGIRDVIWIYEGREKFRHVIAFQHMDDSDIEFIRNKLNKIVINKDCPERLERSFDCKYCLYKTYCFKYFEDNEKNIF